MYGARTVSGKVEKGNFLISENRVEHSSAYEKHTTYEDKANDSKH